MPRYIITANNTRHIVDVEPTGDDEYTVIVDGGDSSPAEASEPPGQPLPTPSGTDAQMTAPMPGVIDSVVVKVGQRVSPGDTLIVLEAMKMKNDLRTEVAGTVASIHVTPGQQVSFGDPLVSFNA